MQFESNFSTFGSGGGRRPPLRSISAFFSAFKFAISMLSLPIHLSPWGRAVNGQVEQFARPDNVEHAAVCVKDTLNDLLLGLSTGC